MFELRKYHGDRVMSLTYEDENENFSVGIISPGEYEFGSIKSEKYVVTSGEISCWVEGFNKWVAYRKNETFRVSIRKNFKLSVKKTSTYLCYYE